MKRAAPIALLKAALIVPVAAINRSAVVEVVPSNLDREAQNRSRSDFSSQRFQGFQGGGVIALAAVADLRR